MGYFSRFLIAAPLAYFSAGYLVDGIHWMFRHVLGVYRIPWDGRVDFALLWVCGLIAFASLIRHFPRLPRIALAALIAYLGTPYLIDRILWTFEAPMPSPGILYAYIHGMAGLFIYAIAHGWLRRIPLLTFSL
ncbi:MAG: hypothetical protein ABW118_08405 [Candidatus Thiodiazotropha sp.]